MTPDSTSSGKLSGSYQDGIFFTEENVNVPTVKQIAVHKNRQNITLTDIKHMMAQEAVAFGANAVVNFTYGQREHKWWQHGLIKWDSQSWFGEGRAVVIELPAHGQE